MGKRRIEVRVPYTPHLGQKLCHVSPARFRILANGRRWGKTRFAVAEALRLALAAPVRGWFVAPTFPLSRETWTDFLKVCPPELIRDVHKGERSIALINGSLLEWRSGNDEMALRGAGLDFVIIDEAARLKQESWEALRPALSDRQGRAILISTPKGRNWFFDMFTRGQDPGQPDYASWQFPSNTNPYFPPEEWEVAQRDLPELVFRQEYMAEFLEDAASVFRNIEKCATGALAEPVAGRRYVLGVDLARLVDFTVLTVMDVEARQVVAWDRFNSVDWLIQKERIKNMASRYNQAMIVIDSTGVGDPILEDLRRAGLRVQGYKFTNESKTQLVEALMLAFEKEEIHFPPIGVLINELRAFEYEMLPGGTIRYQAPEGHHDDCVISLALAWWGVSMPRRTLSRVVTV